MTTTQKKRGKKQKHYVTSWGETVVGLNRRPDGRWRLIENDRTYTEHDERVAVARFRQMSNYDPKLVRLSIPLADHDTKTYHGFSESVPAVVAANKATGVLEVTQLVAQEVLWPWLRKELLERPAWVAEKVGIPQLASLAQFDLPRESMTLSELWRIWKADTNSKNITQKKFKYSWDLFTKSVGVETVAQVDAEKLRTFKAQVKALVKSNNTQSSYFGRVKSVVKLAIKQGEHAEELMSFLARLQILNAKKSKNNKPSPISPENFKTLLDKAEANQNYMMVAFLLLSLNGCFYVSECLSVNWEEIENNHYVEDRQKTGVLRVTVLWGRTRKALDRLVRSPGAIFKSERGNKYHDASMRKLFVRLRKACNLPVTLKHDNIRDGAYTAACCPEVDFHLANVLAGHSQSGVADAYVKRNPAMVLPAVRAVERHYFGEVTV